MADARISRVGSDINVTVKMNPRRTHQYTKNKESSKQKSIPNLLLLSVCIYIAVHILRVQQLCGAWKKNMIVLAEVITHATCPLNHQSPDTSVSICLIPLNCCTK